MKLMLKSRFSRKISLEKLLFLKIISGFTKNSQKTIKGNLKIFKFFNFFKIILGVLFKMNR